MRTAHRIGAAVAATAAVITGGTVAAHGVTPHQPAYGHTRIRAGIPEGAARFAVTSPDVRDGGSFPATAWANAFGCTGGNQQVRLSWHGAPAGTRSYAVTMFDPDAPTGAGFWHWVSWDIPAADTGLDTTGVPAGAVAGTNDAGAKGYLGPCPPAGDIAHHYRITVYALDLPSLGLPADTPPTVTAFTMSGHVLGYARITATARR
ncbi:YbhB/YbcL family Raf kinase inhibitor-like protein [Streptomyces sp. HPF1205]|uniref:YbhB/YbcL family Raf kinase inhibitor-like protein n=1 Tax=Streptomyces sp. HPF1205 TaxID=2873262 RepID=UPI001CEC7BE1|nr:YbhB/YbcL family Raf kinase inhibitor-like protein [Streptomyces sp. HPF1205]